MGSDHQPHPGKVRAISSRRKFLQLSVAGSATALVGAGLTARYYGPQATGIAEWIAANIPVQKGRRVIVTGANGYPV
jgi:hypothetical protein